MRRKKSYFAMTAAIMLSISMTACGSGNAGGQTQTEAEETTADSAGTGSKESAEDGISENAGIVTSSEELPFSLGQKIESDSFTGNAYIEMMIANDETYHFPQTNHLTFEPRARSSWHSHGGMVLLVTGGQGFYQEEGKPAQILRPGDVVDIEPGVKHWHGAGPDSWFSQIVIFDSHYVPEEGTVPVEEPVTDEQYNNLEMEEYTGRRRKPDNALMFERAKETVAFDTFSGLAYVSSLIGKDNAAGAPDLHYVVFEPGVINNWHIHEGGQILIATDGIGYHQMEGEPVQVLYPGDVALCPPGVKHWHGGSADTSFGHIAVNTNPELTGLTWFDRISEEEYGALPVTKGSESELSAEMTEESRESGEQDGDYVTEGTENYRNFVVDSVLHSHQFGDIHYCVFIPDGYDGSRPYSLYITLPGYQGLYFQGAAMNIRTEEFGFEAQKYRDDMIILAPQLEDWAATSAEKTIALTEYFLEHYSIDRNHVYISGYSGGGETLSLVLEARPELYTAALMCSSQWDGGYQAVVEAKTPVYFVTGESDEYYGAEPFEMAYRKIRSLYEAEGLSKTEIDNLVVLDIKTGSYFTDRGVTNQHGGGGGLFSRDREIMGWLFGGYERNSK